MKKIFIIIGMMFMFILGACAVTTVSAEQTWPLKIWKQNKNNCFTTLCLVDENTGVNYIVVSGQNHRNTPSIAITPRLNADGTLYTGG